MIKPQPDNRSSKRRARDERIAAEPQLKPLDLPTDARPAPVEAHLAGSRHPIAVAGVVENGVVRPLDPKVKLPERARVIIVASEET
ncbi:MAG: hypothetical protein L0Y42_09945 [Phycisphaerales bacterium]|nr:hypothetical protein [Phycisphaerales bacterium]